MCLAYGGVRYKCVNISSIAVCWSDNTPYRVAGLSLADMNMIIITCPSPHTAPALLALTHWKLTFVLTVYWDQSVKLFEY